MTEEEKKAIEDLKEEINKPLEVPEDKFDTFILYNIESARIILNLIDKLQKEIEELRKLAEFQKGYRKKLEQDLFENCSNFVVPKDKIRDKLDEIMSYTFTSIEERHQQNYAYDRIRELLEESE